MILPKIEYFDEVEKFDYWKILFYGPSKAGKTYFISSCPDPYIIDTDGSLRGLPEKSHIPFTSITRDEVIGRKVKPYDLVRNTIHLIRDKKPPFDKIKVKTLCFDGITMLAELLLIEAMIDPRIGGKMRDPSIDKSTFDEYGVVGHRLMDIFTEVDALDINIYGTAGVKVDQDAVTGSMMAMPNIVGSFRTIVDGRFDAVMYLERSGDKHILYTSPYGKYNAGIRRLSLEKKIENPTFKKLFGEKI